MNWLLLTLGAVCGALCRYHAVSFIQSRSATSFPLGTLIINLSGSILLGMLVGLATHQSDWPLDALQMLFGLGFCATYTTFSSFMFETTQLWQQGRRYAAVGNLIGQPLLGIGCAWLGVVLVQG
ncbi:fluoride efflux transporter CrcB [Candidatus Viridilinea mediisalina]|uniref:Fluoride-specific ion channel FluC n=1 Tax=Candidatus Viridilinea mediisalina TaxID=2024553 RepID=A0A2A6RMX7_9CHLR|nr:fluoride efflux transporter CrcB [Candidatus Viridilinea mediisalina]PDW04303.1 hypothetical protein CJ255_04445 [Candidatus Viridilinea mediisalina]